MCGIVGLVAPGLPSTELDGIVRAMASTVVHRGPDDDGFFVTNGVALGMRRLSIIDVAQGGQPAASDDGAVSVVCNGEIYNFQELRADLVRRGHRFRSNSDIEVAAHVLGERGSEGLTRLRGMFALALWDTRDESLLLARDRLGKKPLYYAHTGAGLLFGSEIKALLAADPSLLEPHPDALIPYLRYGYVPEPQTWYRRIRVLPPGHWLRFSEGNLRIGPYWTLDLPDGDPPARDPRVVREELDALLDEAVRLRLVSDVPLGIFLSGGLDSSTVCAYAARAGAPLTTFTIGFDRPDWDESADAAVVAERFGTEHHVLTLREQDLAADLPTMIETLVHHYDQPFGDSSALPTFHLSRLAKEHATVILGGDGGDEVFAGYTSYRGLRFAERYRRLPSPLARTLPGLATTAAALAPAGRRYRAQRVAKVLGESLLPFEDLYFNKVATVSHAQLERILPGQAARDVTDSLAREAAVWPVLASSLPSVTKATYADLSLGLVNGILVKVDRMSMAHSLEVRSPLLDHRLVEYVAALPADYRLRGGQTKAILRDVVADALPPRIMRKRKQGFAVPLREWLRDGLSEMVGDYLEGAHPRLPDAVDRAAVQTVLAEHRRGQADHSQLVWQLLTYAAWQERYASAPFTKAARS